MSACCRMLPHAGPVRSAILHGSTRRHDSNSHDHGGVHSPSPRRACVPKGSSGADLQRGRHGARNRGATPRRLPHRRCAPGWLCLPHGGLLPAPCNAVLIPQRAQHARLSPWHRWCWNAEAKICRGFRLPAMHVIYTVRHETCRARLQRYARRRACAPPAAPVVVVVCCTLRGTMRWVACAPAAAQLLGFACGTRTHLAPQVGPRFNTKYQTAAESALNHCYRSCLEVGSSLRRQRGRRLRGLARCAPLHGTQARPSLHCSCRTATGWQSPCDGHAMREALCRLSPRASSARLRSHAYTRRRRASRATLRRTSRFAPYSRAHLQRETRGGPAGVRIKKAPVGAAVFGPVRRQSRKGLFLRGLGRGSLDVCDTPVRPWPAHPWPVHPRAPPHRNRHYRHAELSLS